MVIPPAKTGRDKSNKKAVIRTAQTKRGNLCIYKPGTRILKTVQIKFIAPNREETPET